jgi:hypothetical protein
VRANGPLPPYSFVEPGPAEHAEQAGQPEAAAQD